jgi:hypothetical protein
MQPEPADAPFAGPSRDPRAARGGGGAPPSLEPADLPRVRSHDEIWAIEDDEDFAFALVWRIARRVEGGRPLATLSAEERTVAVAWELVAEVRHGGFDEALLSPAGDHAAEAPAALRRVGATRTASLVERALEAFPEGAPDRDRLRRARQAQAWTDEVRDHLRGLDEEFRRLDEDAVRLLARWARPRRAAFTA